MTEGSKEALVEIIILNCNGEKIIEECIASIFSKTKYRNYRVVLVDNGSTDSSLDIVEEKFGSQVEVIKLPHNTGFSAGMNRGIEERLVKGDAPYFVLLNNDIIMIDDDWLQKLLVPMEKDERIGVTSGVLKTPTGYLQFGGNLRFNGLTMSYMKSFPLDKDCFVDFAAMAACLVRREVLIKTKGFDEKYSPINSEENDLCMRIKYLGYTIYFIHDLFFFHKHSFYQKKVESIFTYYITKRNCMRFRMLHYPWHWVLLSLVLEFKVILNMFFFRSEKKISFNRTWYKLLKAYLLALFVNIATLGATIDRRTQLYALKKK